MDVLKYSDINPDDAKHMAQRLHRKKDDLNFVRKVFTIDKVEAIDEERSIVARVSTNDRDRDGEVVEPKGIDLSNYTKNPCLLWAHRYDMPAIGKALWSKTDEKGLICKFQFAPTQFADEIYQLYKGGYQRAFSIGFIPMDFDSVEKIHRKVSLLEVSAVPVPANQDALVLEAYQKGMIKSDQLMQDLNVVMTPVSGSVPETHTVVCEKDMDVPLSASSVQPKIDFCDHEKELSETCRTLNEGAAQIRETKRQAEEMGITVLDNGKAEVVTKPETTEAYHRIPVSDGHEGHEIRTITVSEKDGIMALYCVTCKEIKTYLFDVDKFTMAEAEAWVEEHKKMVTRCVESLGIVNLPENHDMNFKEVSPPDLSAEMASLRQDVAAILARLQVTPEPVQAGAPLPAPAPVEDIVIYEAGTDIEIEASPEIVIEPLVPEKSAEVLIDEYIQSADYKRAVSDAIEVALAKVRGRVI